MGGHLLTALCGQGDPILALARSHQAAEKVQQLGATPVLSDLTTVQPAMLAGVDAIVHVAAVTDEWGSRDHFWHGNVEGTRHLLQVAKAAGVKRFVFVGTEAAFFVGQDLPHIDETWAYPTKHRYLYSETKAEAERLVLAAACADMHTLSIRPRLVWGPGDTTVLPALIRMARAGRFAWIDGGRARTSTTHVANLVHALTLALNHGQSGHAYYVADEGIQPVRSFLAQLAATQGVDLGVKSMPSQLARPAAALVENIYRLLRIRQAPPITKLAIDMLSSTITVNVSKAKKELGYQPVMSVDAGLKQLAPP